MCTRKPRWDVEHLAQLKTEIRKLLCFKAIGILGSSKVPALHQPDAVMLLLRVCAHAMLDIKRDFNRKDNYGHRQCENGGKEHHVCHLQVELSTFDNVSVYNEPRACALC